MTEGKGGLLTLIIAAPLLALFTGVGIFAYNASATWTSADNQAAITGLAAVCGSGIIVLGLMIALIVGVPLAIRAYGESGRARAQWQEPPMDTAYRYGHDISRPSQHLALPGPAQPANPWTVTGGGHFDDIPTSQQDERFRLTGGR